MSAALQAARTNGRADGDFGLILNNFDGAAGNSGGSWFLTMLSYSPGFADDLANRAEDWFTSGYMGQQRKIFQPNSAEAKEIIKESLKNRLNQTTAASPLYQAVNNIPALNLIPGFSPSAITQAINEGIVDVIIDTADAITPIGRLWDAVGLYPMLAYYAFENDLNWLKLVRNTAYQPYGMSTALSEGFNDVARNEWSANLRLILPGAFNTSDVASFLSLSSLNPSYYSTSAQARNPAFPVNQFITPASIVIGPSAEKTSILKLLGGEFIQQFQQSSLLSSLLNQRENAALGQQFQSELSIIEAATLSGAFAGDLASIASWQKWFNSGFNGFVDNGLKDILTDAFKWLPNILGARDAAINLLNSILKDSYSDLIRPIADSIAPLLGLTTSNFAVPVSLGEGSARYQNPEIFSSLTDLATAQNYRFIDGGYVDNTTVANIIGDIQNENGIEESFDLTFFVNNTDAGIISKVDTGLEKDLTVPIDLPKLFGDPAQSPETLLGPSPLFGSTHAVLPSVFDRSAWQGETAVWEWNNSDEWADKPENATYLAYYKLDVETIDNPFFSVRGKQKGELNIFTSYNLASGPGPYDPSFFDLYENIYQATREGIINKGGYVHLLSAMGVMSLDANNEGQLSFNSQNDISHLVQIDFDRSNTDHLNLISLHKVTDDGDRIYVGSIGGSGQEGTFRHDYTPQAFVMSSGDSLEFKMQSNSSASPVKGSVLLNESDKGYTLTGLAGGRQLFSATASFAPTLDGQQSAADDSTARDSADDTYFYFMQGDNVTISVDAIAAMSNQLSMIRIDLDPITGEASYLGSMIDSKNMNDLLINTFGSDASGSQFGAKKLNPFSQSKFDWIVPESGYFAPVLLTEEGGVFAMGHDLLGQSTHTYILGDYTVGFEDQFDIASDFDYNDAIVRFELAA